MASKPTSIRDAKGRRLYERWCPICRKQQTLARKELIDRECRSCAKAQGRGFPAGVLVSQEDQWLDKFSWSINNSGYVKGPGGELHRVVMGFKPGDGKEVGHINHNKLDCRRENLKQTTRRENQLEMWQQRRLKNAQS